MLASREVAETDAWDWTPASAPGRRAQDVVLAPLHSMLDHEFRHSAHEGTVKRTVVPLASDAGEALAANLLVNAPPVTSGAGVHG